MFIWFLQSHYPCSRPKSSNNQWLEMTLEKKKVNIAMYLIVVKKLLWIIHQHCPRICQKGRLFPGVTLGGWGPLGSFLAWITTKAFCQEEFNIPHLGKVATTRKGVYRWCLISINLNILRINKIYTCIIHIYDMHTTSL